MAFDYKITKIDRARKIVTVECLPEEPHGKEVHKADEESRSAEEGAEEEDHPVTDAGEVQEEVGRVIEGPVASMGNASLTREHLERMIESLSSKNGPHED